MSQRDPQTIIREAEALVATVQRQIDEADEVFRAQGLDPAKARQVLADAVGEKETAEARALFDEDMAAIEREVVEEAARISFSTPARSGGAKKPRMMV